MALREYKVSAYRGDDFFVAQCAPDARDEKDALEHAAYVFKEWGETYDYLVVASAEVIRCCSNCGHYDAQTDIPDGVLWCTKHMKPVDDVVPHGEEQPVEEGECGYWILDELFVELAERKM